MIGAEVEYVIDAETKAPRKPKEGEEASQGELCGCFMKLKRKLRGSACPLSAWGDQEEEARRIVEARELLERVGTKNRIKKTEADDLVRLAALLTGKGPLKIKGRCSTCPAEAREALTKFLEHKKSPQVPNQRRDFTKMTLEQFRNAVGVFTEVTLPGGLVEVSPKGKWKKRVFNEDGQQVKL
jgi:hypothetical protein